MSALEHHPLATLFPMLPHARLAELALDMAEVGIRDAVVLYKGQVLDGRNRLAAVELARQHIELTVDDPELRAERLAALEPEFVELDEDEDPLRWAWSHNWCRRHLSESQRAMAAARLRELSSSANLRSGNGKVAFWLAEGANVSTRLVEYAIRVLEHGHPELVRAVEEDRISVSQAAELTKLGLELQADIARLEEDELQVRLREERAKAHAAAAAPMVVEDGAGEADVREAERQARDALEDALRSFATDEDEPEPETAAQFRLEYQQREGAPPPAPVVHVPPPERDEADAKRLDEHRAALIQELRELGGDDLILAEGKKIRAARRGTNAKGSVEHYTPTDVLDFARAVLGEIDLDPASCEEANRAVQATRFFSLKDDGLKHEWHGRIWLNCPYGEDDDYASNQAKWNAHLVAEHDAGRTEEALSLVNANTGDLWFRALKARFPVIYTRRLTFRRPENANEKNDSPKQGQALFYLGTRVARFIKLAIEHDVGLVSAPPWMLGELFVDRLLNKLERKKAPYAADVREQAEHLLRLLRWTQETPDAAGE